ncbi:unnamed protein product [Parnassius apollo]|uniref:(apollo) hypothetical protein n=1 Tax=Parnassius apollo TaxID=110799 RepID=A0A8S3YBG9_PARAO|nr:unnamed protein product [Parnassius apollo]
MENKSNANIEKKIVNRTKSYNNGPPGNHKFGPSRGKSLNIGGPVRSLEIALDQFKKDKVINGDFSTLTANKNPAGQSRVTPDLLLSSVKSSNFSNSTDNVSQLSMDLSHYELLRNLSYSNCNSDGAFSGNTCDSNTADLKEKDEHLERYFRSVEMWSSNAVYGDQSGVDSKMFER